MRDYELVFIARSDLDEAAINELINRVKGWITESGGQINKIDSWGKRKLAYLIRKQTEGQYILFDMKMPASMTATLERNLRFLEPVLRFLLISK